MITLVEKGLYKEKRRYSLLKEISITEAIIINAIHSGF